MKKIFANFEEYLLAVILPLMCLIVFANTVGRYTQLFSLSWSDEAARYLMIWMTFLGISAAAKNNAHFQVGLAFMAVPARFHQAIRWLILALTLVFCGTIAVLGVQYALRLREMGQITPALNLPMWFMYGSIPLGVMLMAGRSIQFFRSQLQGNSGPAPGGPPEKPASA